MGAVLNEQDNNNNNNNNTHITTTTTTKLKPYEPLCHFRGNTAVFSTSWSRIAFDPRKSGNC